MTIITRNSQPGGKAEAAAGFDEALRTRGLRLTGPRRVVLNPFHPCSPVRVSRRAPRRGSARHAISQPAREGGLPAAVSPARAESRDQVRRHHVPHRRHRGDCGARSAVDGTWGLKKEYFELSMKLAEPLFKDILAAAPDRVATDCPLAALQIRQG